MSSLIFGDIPLAGMMPMSQGLLPPWVTWLWLAALTADLVFHCGHFAAMAGQHRWYHASHILMLVSMLYMYASMEFKWKWFASSSWVVIFWLSTAAILGWMVFRLVQRRRFSFLWILALVMQAAMIYMWMPSWAPALTWTLTVYFGLETVAWLSGRLDDSRPAMAVGPGDRAIAVPTPRESTPAGASAGAGVGTLHDSRRTAAAVHAPSPVVVLMHDSAAARFSMAVMAASMAYMFAAMQLMR
jgi:hypothetical protein